MSNQRYLIIVCLLVSVVTLAAEPRLRFRHFSIEEGLSQKRISDILQDKRGFVWISSWNGLSRFDGYSFVNYKKSADQSNTPHNSRLSEIKEDAKGNIWCLTYDHTAYLFDVDSRCYIDVLEDIELGDKRDSKIKSIVPLSEGGAWLICEHGAAFRVSEDAGDWKVTTYSFNQNTLKGEKIYTIFQDKEGDEWILTDGGVTIIGNKEINDDTPFSMLCSHENALVLCSSSGEIAYYDFADKRLSFLDRPLAISNIKNLIKLNDQLFALMTNSGIWTYDLGKSQFAQFDLGKLNGQSCVSHIYIPDEQSLWISTSQSVIMLLNLATKEINEIHIPVDHAAQLGDSRIPDLYRDRNGFIWTISSDGYLAYYNVGERHFTKVVETDEGFQLEANLFRGEFFVDTQDNLWIPTVNGVSKITILENAIQHTELDRNYETRSLFLDSDQRLWVGTKAGIIRLYSPDRQLIGYLSPDGRIVKNKVVFAETGIYSLREDSEGNIWIGTKGKGLFLLKPLSSEKMHFGVRNYRSNVDDPYSLSSNLIYAIFEDSRGQIWIGCYGGGLCFVSKKSDGDLEFIHAGNRLKQYPIKDFGFIRCFDETDDGVLLVGTMNGLLTFSSDFNHVEDIHLYQNRNDKRRVGSLMGNDIMHILSTRSGETYLATSDGWVNHIMGAVLLTDSISFQILQWDNQTSVPFLFQALVEDNDGSLWIISEDAIIKYSPSDGTSDLFGRRSLMNKNYYSEAIPVLDQADHLIVGTETGILDIPLRSISKSNYSPPIVFISAQIQGNIIYDVNRLKVLELQPSQRSFSLQFSALDYVNAQEVNYAYRLLGLETEWNYVGKNHSVSYANLPKGEYLFQVMSTNSDGVWIGNIRELPLHVLPKFRETTLAKLLFTFILLLLIGLILYILIYISRLRYKVNFEKQLSDIKLRFFTDISHELRTPLTLIAAPMSEILAQDEITPKTRAFLNIVNNNVMRMTRLVNEILDFRKIQSRKMRLLVEQVELVDLVRKVMSDFELIREEKNIDFRLESQGPDKLFVWIDRDKFEKILFNLLSNAFKYTANGKSIVVQLSENKDNVIIHVIDQGVGIQKDKLANLFDRFESYAAYDPMQPSSGIGLSLVKELTSLHHGSIEVQSSKGIGSQFKLILPKGKEHFLQDDLVDFLLDDETAGIDIEKADVDGSIDAYHPDNSYTVLIVEDNKELRHFLSSILHPLYTVIEADNGLSGWEKTKSEMPDMILTDVMMPVMDGLDMIRHIKEDKNTSHIPIIVLSSKASLDSRLEGLEWGIDDYVTKPFSATYLKAKMGAVIAQRKQLQEHYLSQLADSRNVAISIEPSEPEVVKYDKLFIQDLMQFMEKNIDNVDLALDDLANAMGLSRTLFYRKTRTILGISPIDFIRKIRIKRAIQLIETGEFTLSQVAYMSGFSDPKYFGKSFKKETGVNPSQYRASKTGI